MHSLCSDVAVDVVVAAVDFGRLAIFVFSEIQLWELSEDLN